MKVKFVGDSGFEHEGADVNRVEIEVDGVRYWLTAAGHEDIVGGGLEVMTHTTGMHNHVSMGGKGANVWVTGMLKTLEDYEEGSTVRYGEGYRRTILSRTEGAGGMLVLQLESQDEALERHHPGAVEARQKEAARRAEAAERKAART